MSNLILIDGMIDRLFIPQICKVFFAFSEKISFISKPYKVRKLNPCWQKLSFIIDFLKWTFP